MRLLSFAAGSAALLVCASCSSTAEPADPYLTGGAAVRAAAAFDQLGNWRPDEVPTPVPNAPDTYFCSGGGTWKNVIDSSRTPIRVYLAYAKCGIADSTGRVWMFTTLPRLSMGFTRSVAADSAVTTENALTGNVRAESESVRGTCMIDRRSSVQITSKQPTRITVREYGQICGLSRDTTWSGTVVSR